MVRCQHIHIDDDENDDDLADFVFPNERTFRREQGRGNDRVQPALGFRKTAREEERDAMIEEALNHRVRRTRPTVAELPTREGASPRTAEGKEESKDSVTVSSSSHCITPKECNTQKPPSLSSSRSSNNTMVTLGTTTKDGALAKIVRPCGNKEAQVTVRRANRELQQNALLEVNVSGLRDPAFTAAEQQLRERKGMGLVNQAGGKHHHHHHHHHQRRDSRGDHQRRRSGHAGAPSTAKPRN